jgi:hypothetical protein
MMVASTMVPRLICSPCLARYVRINANSCSPNWWAASRWRNLQMVVSSGTGSRPRSIPTNCRMARESYSASSTAGSDRLNQCCKKWMRSIRSTPMGGRPAPSAFGYHGMITAASSSHGITCSISARNRSRRVGFRYCSKLASAKVCCDMARPPKWCEAIHSIDRKGNKSELP